MSSVDAPNLADLIAQRRAGRSDDELAEEMNLSRSYVQRMSTGVASYPSADKITALARSLGVTENTVWQAVGRSSGFDVGRAENPFMQRMSVIPDTALLDDSQLSLIEQMVIELVKLQRRLSKRHPRTASNGAKVTNLRAARTSTGNEYRGQNE